MSNRPKFAKGNPGRPKGAVNKTTKSALELFEATAKFLQEGTNPDKVYPKHLLKWAMANPKEFYKIYGKRLPQAIEVKGEIQHDVQVQKIDYSKVVQLKPVELKQITQNPIIEGVIENEENEETETIGNGGISEIQEES